MTARTSEELCDSLAADLAWRRKELQQLRTDVASAANLLLNTRLRVAIALLYAHWEGFIRHAVCAYVEYVAAKKPKYDALGAPLLGLSLKSKIDGLIAANAPHIHHEFAEFIIWGMGQPAKFSRTIYEPSGILSSAALRSITERIGVAYDPYELKETLIDSTMCETRHKVAHGEDVQVEPAQYYGLHTEVIGLMNAFAESILDAAIEGTHQRPAA